MLWCRVCPLRTFVGRSIIVNLAIYEINKGRFLLPMKFLHFLLFVLFSYVYFFELELLRNYFEYLYWTTSNQLMKEEQEQLLNLFIKYHKTERHELAPFPYPASEKESRIPELTFTDREWNTNSWICHTTKSTLPQDLLILFDLTRSLPSYSSELVVWRAPSYTWTEKRASLGGRASR